MHYQMHQIEQKCDMKEQNRHYFWNQQHKFSKKRVLHDAMFSFLGALPPLNV